MGDGAIDVFLECNRISASRFALHNDQEFSKAGGAGSDVATGNAAAIVCQPWSGIGELI